MFDNRRTGLTFPATASSRPFSTPQPPSGFTSLLLQLNEVLDPILVNFLVQRISLHPISFNKDLTIRKPGQPFAMPPVRNIRSLRPSGFYAYAFLGARVAQIIALAVITGLAGHFIFITTRGQPSPPANLVIVLLFVSIIPLSSLASPI